MYRSMKGWYSLSCGKVLVHSVDIDTGSESFETLTKDDAKLIWGDTFGE